MRKDILECLVRHGVHIYNFNQNGLFAYTLRTNDIVTPELRAELETLLAPIVVVDYAPLFDEIVKFEGVAMEAIEIGELCTYSPHNGHVRKMKDDASNEN